MQHTEQPQSRRTIGEVIADYLRHVEWARGWPEQEADKACRWLGEFRRFLNKRGIFYADELSMQCVGLFQLAQDLNTEVRRAKRNVLGGLVSYAEEQGYLLPAEHSGTQEEVHKLAPGEPIPPDLVTPVLGGAHLSSGEQRAMARLAGCAGLSADQIRQLRTSEVYIEKEPAFVMTTGRDGTAVQVPLDAMTASALRGRLMHASSDRWVFMGIRFKQMSADQLRSRSMEWLAGAGLEMTKYRLRHLTNAGRVAQLDAGHATMVEQLVGSARLRQLRKYCRERSADGECREPASCLEVTDTSERKPVAPPEPDIELVPVLPAVKVTVISAEGSWSPEDPGRRRLPSPTELLNRM